MSLADVDDCAAVFTSSLGAVVVELGLRGASQPVALPDTARARIVHVLHTDPTGSFVARAEDRVAGFAQATRRGDCWTLVHLFVAPSAQGRGVGRSLLDSVLAYAPDAWWGIIGSTPDPRAITAYARLQSFTVHPTVTARGPVRRSPRVVDAIRARAGTIDDLPLTVAVDERIRGAPRVVDIRHLLETGHDFRVVDGRGYGLRDEHTVVAVAALDEQAAATILSDMLRSIPVGSVVQLPRITANQQWAIAVANDAGLTLRPWGPLVLRGRQAVPSPFLPHPALC